MSSSVVRLEHLEHRNLNELKWHDRYNLLLINNLFIKNMNWGHIYILDQLGCKVAKLGYNDKYLEANKINTNLDMILFCARLKNKTKDK